MSGEATGAGERIGAKLRWAASAVGAASALAAVAAYVWFAPAPRLAKPAEVIVETGEPFASVAAKLAEAGVVRSAHALRLHATLSGDARRIKPGDYEFSGGETMSEVVEQLVRGEARFVTVAIPEGLTLRQIARRLAETGLVCEDEFERAAREGRTVRALGLGPLGAEGYLFPATYRLSPRADAEQIVAAMLARFYRSFTPAVEERMFELGVTARELVTLASIVEKEAKAEGERRIIAGVMYNRLGRGMPLQADPTAEYALAGREEVSTAEAVRMETAFNTYAFAGLPPGPIANPGLRSIEAALYPAETDYLYFVAREDGTHVFSRTYAEHKRAIAEQKRIAARNASKAARSNHAE